MSLYNKYRPKSLSAVIGQKQTITSLRGMLQSDRIRQAILLSGPFGTGKTTLARLIAKYVNCESLSKEGEPCNKCKSCVAFNESKVSSFITEINAANNRGIDDVRSLIEMSKFGTRSSKYRIIIMDEVHMLTPTAFQALLKPLEEPPKKCIFILCTTELHKVPGTIKSRLDHYHLNLVPTKDIAALLYKIVGHETKVKLPKNVLMDLAECAEGHVRDAISFVEPLINILLTKGESKDYIKNKIQSYVKEVSRTSNSTIIQAILLNLYIGNMGKVFKAIDMVEENRASILEQSIMYHIRAMEYIYGNKQNPLYSSWYAAIDKFVKEDSVSITQMGAHLSRFTQVLAQMKSYILDEKILFYNAFVGSM
jgi:DNA polymerase III subunit gamma/tau